MKFTMKSPLTGRENTLEIDITTAEYLDWKNGTLIQDAMPNLTPDVREFLITGLTAEDWKAMFGDAE